MVADVDQPDDDPLLGSEVGKYEVVRKLGHGGMGRIYEAINPTIGKRVALKLLDPALADCESAAARFTREAQAASAASSPHIVEIYDAGIADDGSPFIVMELLEGESLSARIEREGRLDAEESVRIVAQVLRGLIKAHEAGIVHRDLKPDNVFLVDRDHDPPVAKILDFGVSKVKKTQASTTLTREGSVLGTPAYMSPEQAQGEADVDARSDIWSIGAILYECLSGDLPFQGNSYEQMIVRICTERPKPLRDRAPGVPDRVADVVERCLDRDRAVRPATAVELLAMLTGETPVSRPRTSSKRDGGRAADSFGTDSTIEAPGVPLRATKSTGVPTTRYGLPIGVVLLVACVALVLWSRKEDPVPTTASASPIASVVPEPPVASSPPPAPAPAPSQMPSAVPSAAPSASAVPTSQPSVAAAPPRPRWVPPPPPPKTAAPPPPPPPKPKGIGGDVELRKD
jgi:serine/threonine protein kinase